MGMSLERRVARKLAGVSAVCVWTGAVSEDWTDPANWRGGVPGPADKAVFGKGAQRNCVLPGGTLVKGIRTLKAFDKNIDVGDVRVSGDMKVYGGHMTYNKATICGSLTLGSGTENSFRGTDMTMALEA